MNLRKCLLTSNNCYKAAQKITPKGIMWHSTGADNPNLRRYVQPDDGLLGTNSNGNHWNVSKPGGYEVCVHAFIGKLADGSIATYQTLPWDYNGWHCGGSANSSYIGFEICEDGLADKSYFDRVYREAVEFSAYLCRLYGLNPLSGDTVIDHSTGYKLGMASNHNDVMHWFSRYGVTLAEIRQDVGNEMAKSAKEEIDMTKEEVQAMIQAEATKIADARIAAYFAALEKKTASKWAEESWEKAHAAGILDGTMPRALLTREQAAATYDRMGLLDKKE